MNGGDRSRHNMSVLHCEGQSNGHIDETVRRLWDPIDRDLSCSHCAVPLRKGFCRRAWQKQRVASASVRNSGGVQGGAATATQSRPNGCRGPIRKGHVVPFTSATPPSKQRQQRAPLADEVTAAVHAQETLCRIGSLAGLLAVRLSC